MQIDNIHNDPEFAVYPSEQDNPLIYYKGSKFYYHSTYNCSEYFYCLDKDCTSNIIIKKDTKNKIVSSVAKFECEHEASPQIDLNTRVLQKKIIHNNKEKLNNSSLKVKYEEELNVMFEETGTGASYESIEQTVRNNMPRNTKIPTTVDEFITALHETDDLKNDKWNTIKIGNCVLFFTDSGLQRLKDSELLGIDGNHCCYVKLKDNKNTWSQIITFVPV